MKNKIWLVATVIAHYIVFVSFVLTCLLGFVYLPWFVAITLVSLIVRVIFSAAECPLTTFENKIRSYLDILPSKGFLKDYILYPNRTFRYLISKLQ